MDKGQFLLYQTPDGDSQIEVKLQNDTVWLSLDQMAELFQRNKSTISRHVKNVLEDGELEEKSVVAFFATTASDSKTYSVAYYNLDMIISVGYRVHSYRGVQFRIWATKVLKEYIVKGFAMNDDLLKRAGGGNYFDELLARIRDIRSCEKVFYRKVLEIYALSIDYDPRVEMTQKFFKTVQNKMHYSVHGHTAAEIIYERADGMNLAVICCCVCCGEHVILSSPVVSRLFWHCAQAACWERFQVITEEKQTQSSCE